MFDCGFLAARYLSALSWRILARWNHYTRRINRHRVIADYGIRGGEKAGSLDTCVSTSLARDIS
jgi:hypothetical protein